MNRLAALASQVPGALQQQVQNRDKTMRTGIKVSALLVIVFHGDPDLIGALVGLVGRIFS
jgi:hypothetical protein